MSSVSSLSWALLAYGTIGFSCEDIRLQHLNPELDTLTKRLVLKSVAMFCPTVVQVLVNLKMAK